MRHFLATIITLFLVPQLLTAQVFINTDGNVLGDEPAFNIEYLKKHRVKSIQSEITGKKEMEVIRDKGHKAYYRFLQNGKLLMHYKTLDLPNGVRDTVAFYYEYDNWGRQKVRRTTDANGFYSHHYLYDSLNRPLKDNLYRDVNIGSRKTSFIPGGFTLIQREHFSYERTGNEEKKRYFNSEGKEYKKEVSIKNDDGQLKAFITSFTLGNRISKVAYSYDDKGRLIKKSTLDNWTNANEMEFQFKYDANNNLIEENKYKNGAHLTLVEYLYKEDGRLYARLEKEIATNYITIYKYHYKFYR